MTLALWGPVSDIMVLGGWLQTCLSPTGSDPEGSSPNEFGAGCMSSLLLSFKARCVTFSPAVPADVM